MVDKISSWRYVEEYFDESEPIQRARMRAEELGVECITASVGAQLAALAAASGAKAIIEAGTGTGVSGLYLLHGAPNAILATIDIEPEHQAAAKVAFTEAGVKANQTRVISGRAIDVMSNMADAAYDLIVLDADRDTLEEQVRESNRLLRPGGTVVVPHALWRDRVPDPAMRDEATAIFRDVLRSFKQQESYVTALSPVGDGLLVATKLGI